MALVACQKRLSDRRVKQWIYYKEKFKTWNDITSKEDFLWKVAEVFCSWSNSHQYVALILVQSSQKLPYSGVMLTFFYFL